jgi:hypothetical protein
MSCNNVNCSTCPDYLQMVSEGSVSGAEARNIFGWQTSVTTLLFHYGKMQLLILIQVQH